MLTTNLRTTQTLDPTGVARPAAPACVTAVAYETATTGFAISAAFNGTASNGTATNGTANRVWSFEGRKPMPTVDLHPDRWPLHSTS